MGEMCNEDSMLSLFGPAPCCLITRSIMLAHCDKHVRCRAHSAPYKLHVGPVSTLHLADSSHTMLQPAARNLTGCESPVLEPSAQSLLAMTCRVGYLESLMGLRMVPLKCSPTGPHHPCPWSGCTPAPSSCTGSSMHTHWLDDVAGTHGQQGTHAI